MSTVLETAISGVLMGALYGLVALGLSLVFGIMKVINFAHGAFMMIAMYAVYWLWRFTDLEPYTAIPIVMPVMFGAGYVAQAWLIEPVFRKEYHDVREPMGVLLLTAGLSMVLVNAALLAFSADLRSVNSVFSTSSLKWAGLTISKAKLIGAAIATLATVGLHYLLQRTEMGRALRATAQDREAARLMGIDDYQMYRIAFGLGTALVALAGGLLAPFYYVSPTVGIAFELRSFVIVVLGGLGSVAGAYWGGVIIGVIEALSSLWTNPVVTEALIFGLFVAVLLVRPSGLLGIERS